MATVKTAGGLIPGTVDTPLDARSRVSAEAEIMNIENPVLGALVFCSGNGKYYKITALKSKQIGPLTVENAAVAEYGELQSGGFGENNVALTEQAQVSGFYNVAGGTPYRITGYGADNRTLTLALPTGETLPAAAAGTVVYVHVSKSDDASPQAATVESVDAAAGTVVLTAALTLPTSVTELSAADDPAFLVFPATSWETDESSLTAGDYNLNAGCGATVQGSICVNVADYASVSGLCNVNSGESAAVSGVGNVNHGPESDLGGVNNLNTAGRGVFIRGGNNKAASDDVVIFGRGNTVSGMGAVVFGNCNTEISGREAFGFGNRLTLTGKYAHAIGYSLTVAAPDAMLIGRHGALADTPDNEGAFGIAGGEKDAPAIGFLHRVRKSVANPLYAPAKDADHTGVDSDGEKQYIAEPAFSTEYRGHLLAVSETVTLSGVQTVTLDHDRFARWLLAGYGRATLALANWKDGDSGELIVDTTKQTINIPAEWVTLGADIAKTPGVHVLEIAMVGDTVFYAIKWPNSGGTVSSIGDHISIVNDYWYIDGVSTGVKARGDKGDKGDTGAQGPQGDIGATGAKGDKGDTGAAAGFGTPTAAVAALAAGATPTVQVSVSGANTAKVFSFSFGIPKGDKGDKGDKGETGATGAAGAAPVRGTDYWTAADIATIKSYVDTAILNGTW